jgi:hypothetical protein
MTTEDLEFALSELENEYAERIAMEARKQELNRIWGKIQEIRQIIQKKGRS